MVFLSGSCHFPAMQQYLCGVSSAMMELISQCPPILPRRIEVCSLNVHEREFHFALFVEFGNLRTQPRHTRTKLSVDRRNPHDAFSRREPRVDLQNVCTRPTHFVVFELLQTLVVASSHVPNLNVNHGSRCAFSSPADWSAPSLQSSSCRLSSRPICFNNLMVFFD